MKFLMIRFVLLMFFLTSSFILHAQDSLILDSTLDRLSHCVLSPHREAVNEFRDILLSSGILHRMDSMQADHVYVEASGYNGNYSIDEYYYNSDSIPFAVFEHTAFHSGFRTSDVFSFFFSWRSYTEEMIHNKQVEYRPSQFIRVYRRGCLDYGRVHAHRIMKQMIRSYNFRISLDRTEGKAYSTVSVPPKHKLFILKIKYGGF